jgi:ankyrin repeat protein
MTLTQRPPSPDDVGYDSDKEYEISSAPALTTSFALQKDPARQAFDEIINDAQQGKLMLATGAYRKSFTEKYREHLNARVTPENQTLLHLVANQVGHLPLSLYLVRHHSHLLQTTDDSNKTPLYIAIVRRNFNVLKAILDKFTGDLDKLLAVTCDHGRNSIHAAIYYDLDENYTLSFIKKASEETLCARDHDGLTPLHLAVHYNRCSKSQLGIVQALIARGDRALDEFSINPPKLSVFEYHQHTRKEAEQPRANPETGPGSEPTNNSTPGLGINPAARNKKQREPGTPTNHDDESMAEMAPVHPTNAHSLDKFPHSLPNDDANVEGPAGLEQGNEGAHNGRGTGAGAEVVNRKFSVSEQGPHKAPTRKRLEEDRVKGEWADKTCQEIKLYYLRSTFQSAARPYPRDQNQALRFLHGANIQGTVLLRAKSL